MAAIAKQLSTAVGVAPLSPATYQGQEGPRRKSCDASKPAIIWSARNVFLSCYVLCIAASWMTSGDGQPEDGHADAGGGVREALRRGAGGLLENLLHVSRRGGRVRADRQGEV